MKKSNLRKKALQYHKQKNKPGKIGTIITKPANDQNDLSLAYSPGVAEVSLEIQKRPKSIFEYTNRGNFVAVITNGSAILGLGDLGPGPAYPVMEGKSFLFKNFANIDSIPICLQGRDKNQKTNEDLIIKTIQEIHYSFGAINLEDIKAPECFHIEETLKKTTDIPIFHDDQHGTAIITLAALYNALELNNKKIDAIKCLFIGAGAAGIATAKLFVEAGVKKQNIIMLDSKGVIHKHRKEGMNSYKEEFSRDTKKRKLEEAIEGVDVFIGVSVKDILKPKMIKKMNEKPIIFALANPWPEIMPDKAIEAGAYIIGTGRSDFPNQINNVLGFPGIFRGILDVQAKNITTKIKLAAAQALSQLAKEKIPKEILSFLKNAYPKDFKSGIFDGEKPLKQEYIIPKPLDPRVVPRVARFVAQAAINEKEARKNIEDFDQYEKNVAKTIKKNQEIQKKCNT